MIVSPDCDTSVPMSRPASPKPPRIPREPYGEAGGALVALRLPRALVERIERLGRAVGVASRSRVMREALRLGVEALERRHKR